MKRPALIGTCLATLMVYMSMVVHHQLNAPYKPWSCTLPYANCVQATVQGHVDPAYDEVRRIFQHNLDSGEDVGAGVAVYVRNQLVVNLQGGWQQLRPRVPYTENTLQLVYSCTKMLAYIVTAQFVQKGLLDYDFPIAHYWREFAQGNKENVTVADLVQHAGGVGYLDKPLSFQDAIDRETFSAILAGQQHNFGGARTRAYHAVTGGWYLNEIIRRVDPQGRTIGQIAETDLRSAYGVEWHLAPGNEYDARIAELHFLPLVQRIKEFIELVFRGNKIYLKDLLQKGNILYKTVVQSMPDQVLFQALPKSHIRPLEGPSYSGYTNAYSIAKLAAMMANRGHAIVPGEPDMLNETTYVMAMQPMPLEYDVIIKRPMPILKGGFGFNEVQNINMVQAVDGVVFNGWKGVGGSLFYWNEEYQIGFGYVTNAFRKDLPDNRSLSLLTEVVKQAKLARNTATHTSRSDHPSLHHSNVKL
ncbi:beta-lactamase/transpeptidase-like protein [Gongronella butleri]|nr:beta-lactamase/transpeptidase-like protein [Gongronella butleri]